MVARFTVVQFGLQDQDLAEVLDGVTEGQQVVTTGAAALRDGDPVVPAGPRREGGRATGPGGSGSTAPRGSGELPRGPGGPRSQTDQPGKTAARPAV